jgi:hypothetical protein
MVDIIPNAEPLDLVGYMSLKAVLERIVKFKPNPIRKAPIEKKLRSSREMPNEDKSRPAHKNNKVSSNVFFLPVLSAILPKDIEVATVEMPAKLNGKPLNAGSLVIFVIALDESRTKHSNPKITKNCDIIKSKLLLLTKRAISRFI